MLYIRQNLKVKYLVLSYKQDTKFEKLKYVNKARVSLLFRCVVLRGLSFNEMVLWSFVNNTGIIYERIESVYLVTVVKLINSSFIYMTMILYVSILPETWFLTFNLLSIIPNAQVNVIFWSYIVSRFLETKEIVLLVVHMQSNCTFK